MLIPAVRTPTRRLFHRARCTYHERTCSWYAVSEGAPSRTTLTMATRTNGQTMKTSSRSWIPMAAASTSGSASRRRSSTRCRAARPVNAPDSAIRRASGSAQPLPASQDLVHPPGDQTLPVLAGKVDVILDQRHQPQRGQADLALRLVADGEEVGLLCGESVLAALGDEPIDEATRLRLPAGTPHDRDGRRLEPPPLLREDRQQRIAAEGELVQGRRGLDAPPPPPPTPP